MPEHEEIVEIKIQNDDGPALPDESGANKGAVGEHSADEIYEQLLRTQADFVNYKRRTEARLLEWRAQSGRDILSRLLPIMDDFDIFFSHHADDGSADILAGVRMIHSKVMSTMKELGLTVINPEGEVFDPAVHDAVMTEESDQVEEGKIIRVWQKGYFLNGVLLRPAKVIAAAAKTGGESNVE